MFARKKRIEITPIMRLIKAGDLESVQSYFENAENLKSIDACTPAGVTLLHWAVLKTRENNKEKMLPIIQFLLDLDADQSIPEQGSNRGYPLISAARRALPEVVSMLLEDDNCYVHFRDAKNKTALDYVAEVLGHKNKSLDLTQRFSRIRERLEPLAFTVAFGH